MSRAVIVGVGARTPLGLDAVQTAFSIRTGLPAMREAALVDAEGERITMCFLPTLDPLLTGAARAFALGHPALSEAVAGIGTTSLPLRARLALALDEFLDASQGGWLAARLASVVTPIFPDIELVTSARGPAGSGYLLQEIVDAFASNRLDLAILGGVHTDYDPERIAALDGARRLFRPPDDLAAVLPGEAAGFVVLVQPALAERLGWDVHASLQGVATGFEEARPDNDVSAFRATGLTAAMRTVLAPLAERGLRAGWVLTDLGFETFRHFEQQAALTRAQRYLGEPQQMDSPAQRIGYMGAAAMPLHMVLGVEAFRRGYAPHPWMLSVAGSDGGERAALLVSAAS